MERVKIVGTLGPSSSSAEVIRAMIQEGLDVTRLNFSHGDHQTHKAVFETVRAEAKKLRAHVAVLADLCGPKIRTGDIAGEGIELVVGGELVITTDEVVGKDGRVSCSYKDLPRDVVPGSRILFDDGLLEVEVVKVEGDLVKTRVLVGGLLKARKGVNIPNTPLSTSALTEKDKRDLSFAKELGVDYIALSFVRSAADVSEAKELAGDIPVIAKIEKPEAVACLEEILEVADGVMVARGDLGVEAGAEKVPLLQKKIITEAGILRLPVIVATQMLDSMIRHPRPTRAEVSDVANAVLDGTDAVMLSGETAAGAYPVESVKKMAAILAEVEASEYFHRAPKPVAAREYSFSEAIAAASVTAAQDLNLKALAVYTETGHSPALVSACRPLSTIVAFSRHEKVLRRLALRWGVLPLYAEWVLGADGLVSQAERVLLDNHLVEDGDDIAITFGMQDMRGPGRTDVLKLWRVVGT